MTSRSGAALEQQVLTILLTRISALNARSILTKAVERAGLSKDGYGVEQLPVLVAALAPGCRLFLGDDATVVLDAIIALGGTGAKRPTVRVDVVIEADISLARRQAQIECVHAHASGFALQRVVTMVSELARNIISYSKGGYIEIIPLPGKLVVVAIDRGPGIADVEHVLSGNYKSRTGLGKGLLGVKRLSNGFDISSTAEGTRVRAEVTV